MKAIGLSIAALLVIAGAFAVGFSWRDLRSSELPSSMTWSRLFNPAISKTEPTATELFKQHYDWIRQNYYKTIDKRELKYAAMEGLMSSLGDPHTMFFDPDLAERFQEETSGGKNYYGIGARLSPDPLGARIMSVFRESPASQAGIKTGDVIVNVDGLAVSGMNVDDIVGHIIGEKPTVVKLQIIRGTQTFPIQVKRGNVTAPTAEAMMIDGTDYGLVTVWSFSENTTAQFDQSLQDLKAKGAKGLIIDLRGNPGGLLNTAIEMLSRFVDSKIVVTMKKRGGQEEVTQTFSGMAGEYKMPIAILIDEDSASAAEIFSGVMKDYGMATLVGDHSYGKASVQNVLANPDGSLSKITIARYYLPGGEDISRKVDEEGQYVKGGLKPDVLVPLDLSPKVTIRDPRSDNQIKRAIKVLDSKR